ncbi:MAG: DUF4241 domain-containing protein [Betaproteobacteria bacterium]|nr:DUF4241 domain-containing protein [Betaproteobacteria bacterium]
MAERVNGKWLVGRVGVDAGMVMVGDPCYLDKFTDHEYDDAKVDAQKAKGKYDYSYSGACAATLSENSAGELGRADAVAVSSGYGDGVYPVYAHYNHEGRIERLEVVFVPDEEEEDVEEDEEKEYSCHECDTDLTEDEVTWATDDGVLTMNGNPYCDGCLPEEKEEN